MDKKQNLNKGFSLVEILVALAVGSIVLAAVTMLIIMGVNNYRKETANASAQNEANIAMNQIADNIMEADCFTVKENSDGTTEYIVKYSEETVKDESGIESTVINETKYRYDPSKGTICYGNDAVLCQDVEEFKIYILSSSLKKNDKGEYVDVNNPFRVMISLKVSKMKVDRAITREISFRNDIDVVTLPGGMVSKSQNKLVGGNLIADYIKEVESVTIGEETTTEAVGDTPEE